MTFLCFVLDLRSLSHSSLKDLKQNLLRLANLYAISSSRCGYRSGTLDDLIGLCYIHRNRSSGFDELEIAHCPQGEFNLRGFHHAVNSLPDDCFLTSMDPLVTVSLLSKLFQSDYLYSWGGETTLKKVSVISSLLEENISLSREVLMDDANKRVKMEFILVGEHQIDLCSQATGKIKDFVDCTSDMENCIFKRFPCDDWLFSGLVKSWLQDLEGDIEGQLQAVFYFKNNLLGSIDYISCNLFVSAIQMLDDFVPCKTCRCHGLPINGNSTKPYMSCPATNQQLAEHELIETGVIVGDHTVLHLPSFHSYSEPQRIHGPISFNVVERTNLSSLSEGAIIGTSYVVVPHAAIGSSSAEFEKQELNTQLFYGICGALHSLDQGLVCVSTCNTETMRESGFNRFYLLQSSEKGPMLLRKLAGSEEIMPIPCAAGATAPSSVSVEIESSIQANLLKMDLRTYNPLRHELGFHTKLNALVKESLQIGTIAPKLSKPDSKTSRQQQESATSLLDSQSEDDRMVLTQTTDKEREACIEDEWVQLVVNELSGSLSPALQSFKKNQAKYAEKSVAEKTSSILERLEPPRSQKLRSTSPAVDGSDVIKQMTQPAAKRPLIPFEQNDKGKTFSLSQPLKPNFQRFKRKVR